LGRTKMLITERKIVYVVGVPSTSAPLRRFLDIEEARKSLASTGGWGRLTQVLGSPRDLYRWGLGPLPEGYAPRKTGARKYRSHPPVCPNCHARWFGPGRPRKDGSRNVVPVDPAEYDGPDPSTLVPRSFAAAIAEEGREGLAGLADPRLRELDDMPPDW